MSIRMQSFISFGIIIFLFLGNFGFQFIQSNSQIEEIQEVNEKTLQSALLAQDIQQLLNIYQLQLLLPAAGAATVEEVKPMLENDAKEFAVKAALYAKLNPEENNKVSDIIRVFTDFTNGNTQEAISLNEQVTEMKNHNVDKIRGSLNHVVTTNEVTYRNSLLVQSIIIVVALLCSYFFARSLTRPIHRLIQTSRLLASGDLSKPQVTRRSDEIGQLTSIIEQMRVALARFVQASQQSANQVVASSEMMTDHTLRSSQSILRMMKTLQQIADGAQVQMKSTGETAAAMEEISNGVMQISESSLMVTQLSTTNGQQAQMGNQMMIHAERQMDGLKQTVYKFAEQASLLEKHSNDINQIIHVIKSISSQTNLLSLNASIEASRAGEHGKGFMVVATEIRKLAEQTKSSSDNVHMIIERIQEDTKATVKYIEAGNLEVEQTEQSVRMAREAFGNIQLATLDIAMQSQEVSAAIEQMTAGTQEVSASVTELADIARLAYNEIEGVVNEAEQQRKLAKELSDSTLVLNETSLKLKDQISGYKV